MCTLNRVVPDSVVSLVNVSEATDHLDSIFLAIRLPVSLKDAATTLI